MDGEFWRTTNYLETITFSEEGWADAARALESVRLDFINLVRRDIVGVNDRLDELPMDRPPLPQPT
jgi:hypothetical protein